MSPCIGDYPVRLPGITRVAIRVDIDYFLTCHVPPEAIFMSTETYADHFPYEIPAKGLVFSRMARRPDTQLLMADDYAEWSLGISCVRHPTSQGCMHPQLEAASQLGLSSWCVILE